MEDENENSVSVTETQEFQARKICKPCDKDSCSSGIQKKISKFLNTSEQWCSKNANTSILVLNDDCLEYICRKLPLSDQINFAWTCKRFFNVMTCISKTKHAHVSTDTFQNWPQRTIINFFRVVGTHIKFVELKDALKQPILSIFVSYCTNIISLKVNGCCLGTNAMVQLIDKMESLEMLELISSQIEDEFIFYLKKFKHLKKLTITGNQNLTGKYLQHLTDLEVLAIRQCFNLTSENFQIMCLSLRKLRHLDMMYCSFFKPGDCALLSSTLLQLENLKLTCSNDDLMCLKALPKLRRLELQTQLNTPEFFHNLSQLTVLNLKSIKINPEVVCAISLLTHLTTLSLECSEITDMFLDEISNLRKLEYLQLSSCHNVSNRAVLDMLKKCLQLRHFQFEYLNALTDALLNELIPLLQQQRKEGLRSERIFFTGTCTFLDHHMTNLLQKVHKFSDLIVITLKDEVGLETEYAVVWE